MIGLIAGVLIEYFGNTVWKLWHYPTFSLITYLIILPLILIAYFDLILKGYLACRVLIIKFFGAKKIKIKKWFSGLFPALGILGGLGMLISIVLTIPIFSSTNPALLLNTYSIAPFSFFNVIIAFISLLFILEYLGYREHEDTFLMHLFENDWTPIISIAVASFLTAILMEGLNLPFGIWQYSNWPFQNIRLLGIPLAILIAWLVQYPILISIYHIMYRQETRKIWDN